MNVIQNLVPESKYGIKCPYAMVPEGVCVHNTANDASARNEVAYMIRNEEHTSFHYAVDDIEVVQGIPENRTASRYRSGTCSMVIRPRLICIAKKLIIHIHSNHF